MVLALVMVLTSPGRGSSYAVSTTINIQGQQSSIYALGWMAKKDACKTFIASCSDTNPGEALVVPRYNVEVINNEVKRTTTMRSTPRPTVLNQLFKHFGKIDLHDRYRQGKLQLEVEWETRKWWHRIFSTMLGIIVTDCYLAYQYEYNTYHEEEPNKQLTYIEFLGELAYCLIF